MKLLIHILMLLVIKLPLQLIGILIIPLIVSRYNLGRFPKMFRYFDDYRAVWLHEKMGEAHYPYHYGQAYKLLGDAEFGAGHMDLFLKYNSTWLGRYKWAAFRNAVNYFQHKPLGKIYGDKDIFQYYGTKPIFDTGYAIRYNVGYKYWNDIHARHMLNVGIPLQWVVSIGLRKI